MLRLSVLAAVLSIVVAFGLFFGGRRHTSAHLDWQQAVGPRLYWI